MRPLLLRMQAFGPYAARQELDFADLKGRRFFLIHGPTGSGKTTVLDAMAFALYGDTSGAERDAADMRSDQAAPDLLTEITFDFAIGTEHYRAWRRPAQDRPKQRGEGVTRELQDATLWRLEPAGGGDPAEVRTAGKPLAAGWTKVSAKAVEILGFRAEQFRQVVMLPQGRFQELLKADSAGRADILATLFTTQHYARLERELKDAAGTARRALDDVVRERALICTLAGLESEEDLGRAREAAAEEFALACEERVRRDEARAEAEAAERAGAEATARLAAAAEASAALVTLESKRADVDALRERERQAHAAAAVLPAGQRAGDCSKAAAAAADARAAAVLDRDEAATALDKARQVLAAEEARRTERQEAARRVAELESLRARIGPLAEAQREAEEAGDEKLRTARRLEEARAALAGALALHAAALEAAQQARSAAAGAPEQALLAAGVSAAADDRRKLDILVSQLADTEGRLLAATQNMDRREQEWRHAADLCSQIEAAWSAGQAAVLAGSLEPGQPCPVCGSPDHPAPARAEIAVPPTDELAAARETQAAALATRDHARAEQAEADAEKRALAATIETLCGQLGSQAERSQQECAADALTAAESAAAAAAAQESLPALEAKVAAAAASVAAAEREAASAQAEADEAERRLAAAGATVGERTSGLPDGLRDAEALQHEIAASQANAAALADALAAAAAADHEAAVAAGGAEAGLTAAEASLQAANAAAAAATAALGEALSAHGFVTADGAPDAAAWDAALCADDQLASIVAAIRYFDDELAAARGHAQRAAEAAAGLAAPDLDALRDAASRAKIAADEAATAATQLQVCLGDLDKKAERLQELRCDNETLDARYTVLGHIAKMVNGENPSGLTLQRFVLGALLDAVLVAATARLRAMSKGRYQLLRTDERRGGRRAAGLDMDVYDAWTGKSRPVSTLSGGESFLAALSLALGLAETVQARTGGIFLDTVFVDEGFGTLDDEALDLAIATLMQLQEGDRLVGIISHVAELKERIDARLEVTAERGVSRARFVVP
jgi:DNA repair protein SbcC/Rad50